MVQNAAEIDRSAEHRVIESEYEDILSFSNWALYLSIFRPIKNLIKIIFQVFEAEDTHFKALGWPWGADLSRVN